MRPLDDLNNMLNSVLGDPESLKQIMELAEMLKSGDGSEPPKNDEQSGSADSGFDIGMLMQIAGLMQSVSGSDKNRDLLLALRPHLSGERQERVDKAVRMLKLYAMVMALKESGMLNNLDSLLGFR